MNTSTHSKRFSFEFFPPKTEKGIEKLKNVRNKLAEKKPAFFSVTYGAGGTTREGTKNTVTEIKQAGLSVAPHLSFGGDDKESLLELINYYKSIGIDRIVALRGDIPSGSGKTEMIHANQLIEFIRENTGDHFHLEVAAYPEIHPQSINYESDLYYFKQKINAGANSAITQYFYNPDAYFYYLEEIHKQGIDVPVYPGIMPITNFTNLVRFSDACGAEIPRWIRKKLEAYQDDKEAISAFGIEFVSQMCETLLDGGAPGLHFYTMNQAEPTSSIWENLGLS